MHSGSLLLAALSACGAPEPSTLWIADRDGRALIAFSTTTGERTDQIALDRPPSGAAFDDEGAIYTTDFDGDTVYRHRLEGGPSDDMVLADPEMLAEPVQIAYVDGHLLIVGKRSRNLVVGTPDGRILRELGRDQIWAAHDVVVAPGGRAYVATSSSLGGEGMIHVWDWQRGVLIERIGVPEEIGSGAGLALGPKNELYVADELRDRVVAWSAAHRRFETVADVEAPIGIAYDVENDRLFVLSSLGVYVVEAGNEPELVFDREQAGLVGPRRILWRAN